MSAGGPAGMAIASLWRRALRGGSIPIDFLPAAWSARTQTLPDRIAGIVLVKD